MPDGDGHEHVFGGDWTATKLEVLRKYLRAYTTALKAQPFRLGYIDAFAGTGYRQPTAQAESKPAGEDWLMDLAGDDAQSLLDGSAVVALKTEPRFDKYIFIERDGQRCAALESLRMSFPHLRDDIVVRQGDANEQVRQLCSKDWLRHRRRAVLFLDPYGMQIDWSTIEAVAGTRAIDMWLLWPLGMGVNRLVTKSGEIPDGWARRLDAHLGTESWRDELYETKRSPGLFDQIEEREKVSTERIGEFYLSRLAGAFAGVAKSPGVLRNSKGSPLYLLCFAAGNPRGAKPACRIADDVLRSIQ